MTDSARTSPRVSRRTLLKVGVAGGAALLLARWLYPSDTNPKPRVSPHRALDASALAIVAAIVPELLRGALPVDNAGGNADATALDEVVAGVERAVAGLPPAVRSELDDLFSLLSFAPTRCLVAGVWSPWPQASRESIAAFLDRWKDSRFALLRSGYGALHQLILASWYGNPRAWLGIGYSGPPSLAIGE